MRHLLLLAIFVAISSVAAAQPVTLEHSGYLLGADDRPVSGSVAMDFAIFAGATGGTATWTGSCAVSVLGGYYAVGLGAGCGTGLLASHVPTSSEVYLEVTVGGVTVLPRLRLDPAPAAVDAARVGGKTLAELDARYAKLASAPTTTGHTLHWNGTAWAPGPDQDSGGTVTAITAGTGLTGGTISTTGTLAVDVGTGALQIPQLDASGKLAASTIPTIANDRLADGSVTLAKLATSGATTAGQVVKWNGTAWVAGTDAGSQWANGAGGSVTYTGGSVGIGTATPNAAAALDVGGTTQGLLPPRLTEAQRNAIVAPPAGLLVFNTTRLRINMFDGTEWLALAAESAGYLATAAAFAGRGGYMYFPLNEPSGTKAYARGDATRWVDGSATISSVGGYLGTARYFNTGTDFMRGNVAATWLPGNASHTAIITFKLGVTQSGVLNALASLGWIEGQSRNHAWSISSVNRLGGGYYSDDYWSSLDATTSVPVGSWVQAAWAYDATAHDTCVYLNGVQQGCVYGSNGNTAKNFTNDFTIGGWIHTNNSGEKPDQITIGEVAVFDRRLAATDVSEIYQGSIAAGRRIVTN